MMQYSNYTHSLPKIEKLCHNYSQHILKQTTTYTTLTFPVNAPLSANEVGSARLP